MGFNSWYMQGPAVNEGLIKAMADYLCSNRLAELGYKYVVLDEGWTYLAGDPKGRDALGNIMPDRANFPSGMKALADYAHERGLKFGIYTQNNEHEAHGFIGSAGHFDQDAESYASWGVDFIKFDVYTRDDYRVPVINFANAIDATGRPMFLYCGIYHQADPSLLQYVNSLRFTGDLTGSYSDLISHIFYGASLPDAVGKDHWVDVDVLTWVDGKEAVSLATLKTSMTMYAMLSAPMFLPAFLDPALYPSAFSTITNVEVIAVDQDPAAVQGRCVATNGGCYVWVKPLGASDSLVKAVALLNTDMAAAHVITADWSAIGLPPGVAAVRDLWQRSFAGFATNSYSASIPPGSVGLFKISPYFTGQSNPRLSISVSEGNIVVSWPSWPPGFTLESSAALDLPRWTPTNDPAVASEGTNVIVWPATGDSKRFFRLSY